MFLKNWMKRGIIFGLIILLVSITFYLIRLEKFYITLLEFVLVLIPSMILGLLFSLFIEFCLYQKMMRNKKFKIFLFVIFIILSIPSIVVLLIFASFDPNYCSEEFFRIHEEQSKIGDTSICDTFEENGYTDSKLRPVCYDKETRKPFTKLDCVLDVAKETQDIKICDRMTWGNCGESEGCEYWPTQCLEAIVNLIDNPNLCYSLVKHKEDCLEFIAENMSVKPNP